MCVFRWEEDTEGVHMDLRQKSLDWLAECFEAAHQTARQAIDFMCNFIGMKVLLLSAFMPWYQKLSTHTSPKARSSLYGCLQRCVWDMAAWGSARCLLVTAHAMLQQPVTVCITPRLASRADSVL